MMWGELWEMFVIVTSLYLYDGDNTGIFLKQLIQFFSINGTKQIFTT